MSEDFMTPEVAEMARRIVGEAVGSKPLILIMDSQGCVHRFENDHLCLTMTDAAIRIYVGDTNGGLPCPYTEFRVWQWIKTYNLPFSNCSVTP